MRTTVVLEVYSKQFYLMYKQKVFLLSHNGTGIQMFIIQIRHSQLLHPGTALSH